VAESEVCGVAGATWRENRSEGRVPGPLVEDATDDHPVNVYFKLPKNECLLVDVVAATCEPC
jgi:hypothetical protein